ncbi:MAG TPA: protein-export chaperone SecB, partial [Alphaproteobacteria bacterium]|nr:protein-export chaperone SecB [Alphaproteobacteria bacterium]
RNIIADLTRESGFPPLLINPIDFVGLYHQRLEEMKKQQEKQTVN